MRRYRVLISDLSGNPIYDYNSVNPDGTDNMSALDVEFDIPVVAYDAPMGMAAVRVWGIPLNVLNQATDLHGLNVSVFGGMSGSYPLNKPAQFGILVQGTIFQAFGNWIGTDQTLDLVVMIYGGTREEPVNLVLNWLKGTPLQTALTNALNVAFPGIPVVGTINPNLIQTQDDQANFETLEQLSKYVRDRSRKVIAAKYAGAFSNYPGVQISTQLGKIVISDGTSAIPATGPVQINFEDMIGQPTWINLATMQMSCVLRADLSMFTQIKMPPRALVTTTASATAMFRQSSIFTGTMQVSQIRHVGRFRQPGAKSWITVVDAFFLEQ